MSIETDLHQSFNDAGARAADGLAETYMNLATDAFTRMAEERQGRSHDQLCGMWAGLMLACTSARDLADALRQDESEPTLRIVNGGRA